MKVLEVGTEEIKDFIESLKDDDKDIEDVLCELGDVLGFGDEIRKERERYHAKFETSIGEICNLSARILAEGDESMEDLDMISDHVISVCSELAKIKLDGEEKELMPHQIRMQKEYGHLKAKHKRLARIISDYDDHADEMTCSKGMLLEQLKAMDMYITALEKRAEVEGVPLEEDDD